MRKAPLGDIGLGIVAVGEGVTEMLTGNEKTAFYSFAAAAQRFIAGVSALALDGYKSNIMGSAANGANATINLLTKSVIGNTGSFSYDALVPLSIAQAGTNAAEALHLPRLALEKIKDKIYFR